MISRTVHYKNFDGFDVEETVHFNLRKSELLEMEFGQQGRFTNMLDKIVKAVDVPSLMKEFKKLLLTAYGEKSPDGKHFNKSKEISEAFAQTEAYDIIFMELITDDEKASKFITELIPADLAEEVAKLEAANTAKEQNALPATPVLTGITSTTEQA